MQNRRSRAGAEPRVHLLSLGSVQGEISLAVRWPISPSLLYCILACSYKYSDPMVVVLLFASDPSLLGSAQVPLISHLESQESKESVDQSKLETSSRESN